MRPIFKNNTVKVISSYLLVLVLILYPALNLMASQEDSSFKVQTKIIVKESNTVNAEFILLKNIADISSPEFLLEEISRIEILRAPKLGQIQVIDKKHIRAILYSKKLIPKDTVLIIPDKVYVKRASQSLSLAAVKKEYLNYLDTIFEGKEYHLSEFKVRGLELYPKGDIKLLFDNDEKPERLADNFSVFADVLVDDARHDKLRISGKLDFFDDLLCAVVPLKRGHVLSKEDVEIKRVSLVRKKGPFTKDMTLIEGKIVKTAMKKGDCLVLTKIGEPPLIHKGDIVQIVVKKDKLLIVTSGISKEDGYSNQQVRVENISSGRIIRGLVKTKSRVEVFY